MAAVTLKVKQTVRKRSDDVNRAKKRFDAADRDDLAAKRRAAAASKKYYRAVTANKINAQKKHRAKAAAIKSKAAQETRLVTTVKEQGPGYIILRLSFYPGCILADRYFH